MRWRWIFVGLLFILITNSVVASQVLDSIPIQIQTLDDSGNIITGTFIFTINISSSSDCSSVLYSNITTQTTDSRGIVSYNLGNVNLPFDQQYWFCYYRNGLLRSTVQAARVPYSFMAKNISLSGVYVDTNFGVGSYNITTTGTLSSPILCLNGDCRGAWPAAGGGTTGIYASGNNANGYYIQFTDGTMMEWGNLLQTITTTQASNGIDYGASNWIVTFPISFINTPTVSVSGLGVSTSVAWVGLAGTLTNTTGFTATPIASNTAGTLNLSWTAIGRWTSLTNLTSSTNYTWAMSLSTGNVILFNNNINVGIGTSSPTQKLEVAGNINVSNGGNLTVSGRVSDKTGFVTPVGAMMQYAGSTAPAGWLLANGTNISRTTYADLFAVIGTTYGAGDGSTTFTLPNMTGRYALGLPSSGTLGSSVGTALTNGENRASGALTFTGNAVTPTGTVSQPTFTGNALPPHTHTFSGSFLSTGGSNNWAGSSCCFSIVTGTISSDSAGTPTGTVSQPGFTGNSLTPAGTITGASAVSGTNAPYIQLNYIIKY